MIDAVYIVMIFIGVFFVLTGAVGVIRLPDPYTRLHAVSKGTTFGFAFIVMGVALLLGDTSDIFKALVAVVFQFSTTPIAAHMIARLGLRKGIVPVRNGEGDPMTDEDMNYSRRNPDNGAGEQIAPEAGDPA